MTTPNNRVSIFAPAGKPRCETCIHLKTEPQRTGGWCQLPENRVFADGWPQGFTPSQGWDGTCDRHVAR